MGAINYVTSDYITLGYNCNVEYLESDFDSREDMEECRQFDIEELHNEIQTLLKKHPFHFYHVVIKPGYYEGFSLDIENNFSIAFDSWEDKKEAQKEITELKQFLIDCAGLGLVACSPGWCTGYSDYRGTISAIKDAVKEMREEAKQTPTWRQYEANEYR